MPVEKGDRCRIHLQPVVEHTVGTAKQAAPFVRTGHNETTTNGRLGCASVQCLSCKEALGPLSGMTV